MEHDRTREEWLRDIQSADDEAVVRAAKNLLALGEFGTPAGSVALKGGKAAHRLGRRADAVVLFAHGLRIVQPDTLLWMELLVNRASACVDHGFFPDAIAAAEKFLQSVGQFPQATLWLPFVHDVLGTAYDRLRQYDQAVPHHRYAVEMYTADPVRRAIAKADLAYSLALSGKADEAGQILGQIGDIGDDRAAFVLRCTTALVRYCQGRFAEAVQLAVQAEAMATGQDEAWAVPLCELRYWAAQAAWRLGDSYRAGIWIINSAVVAEQRWLLPLSEDATRLLTEILERGGITQCEK